MVHAHWPTTDPDHGYIERQIRYWVYRLVGRSEPAKADREDLTQELVLDLSLRLPAFDPSKASRRTFISRIVEHRACTLAEGRNAAKRDRQRETHSLDALVDPNDPEGGTHGEHLSEDAYHEGLSGRSPTEVSGDLAITISMATARMPKRLRRVYVLLHEGFTVTDIADQFGVHRSTVSGRVAEIRRRLKAAGFE